MDGRNPAPVDRWFIPLFILFQPSVLWCRISRIKLQLFLHQNPNHFTHSKGRTLGASSYIQYIQYIQYIYTVYTVYIYIYIYNYNYIVIYIFSTNHVEEESGLNLSWNTCEGPIARSGTLWLALWKHVFGTCGRLWSTAHIEIDAMITTGVQLHSLEKEIWSKVGWVDVWKAN